MNPIDKIKRFFFHKLTKISPTRGFAFLLSLTTLTWGLWVSNPYTESMTAVVYNPLTSIAPEVFWACFALLAGFFQMLGVFVRNSQMIRNSSFGGMMFWTALGCFIVASAPWAPGGPTFIILAIMNGWIYLQVRFHPEIISGNKILPDSYESIEQIEIRESGDEESS